MAFFSTIQEGGDGLIRAQRSLAGLEADPQLLERTRRRFSDSPPPYTSNHSHNSTLFPNPPTNEQQRRANRRGKLLHARAASHVFEQFKAQTIEIVTAAWKADPRTKFMQYMPGGLYHRDAEKLVRDSWIEPGIWDDEWGDGSDRFLISPGQWKHEKPLELESATETDKEWESNAGLFCSYIRPGQQKPRRPKSDVERRRIAEQRIVRERQRQASRPYHQFVYQITKERERIQNELTNEEVPAATTADINIRAYETVKAVWRKRMIWNERWGILPGMSWKHEEPYEEEINDDPTDNQVDHLETRNHEEGQLPRRNPRSTSPTNINHPQVSAVMSTSQQAPAAIIDGPDMNNSHSKHFQSESISYEARANGTATRPTTEQASRPSQRMQYSKAETIQPEASISLGLMNPSKVPKATRRKRPEVQRRTSNLQEVPPDNDPLPAPQSIPEFVHSSAGTTPRRSRRIHSMEHDIAKQSNGKTSTDLSTTTSQSGLKRTVSGIQKSTDRARPQGARKRQRLS